MAQSNQQRQMPFQTFDIENGSPSSQQQPSSASGASSSQQQLIPSKTKSNCKPSAGIFRSEKMKLCQLILQSDVAFETTCNLGELGIIEFRDLNGDMNAYQRKYVDELRHLGEIQRKLIYLNEQLTKEEIEVKMPSVEPSIPRMKEIRAMESRIEDLHKELLAINEHLYSLRLEQFELIEKSKVLSKTNLLLKTTRQSFASLTDYNLINEMDLEQQMQQQAAGNTSPATAPGSEQIHKIYTVTGLIRLDKAMAFRTIIWRVCGQNAFVHFYDLEEPINDVRVNDLVQKKVFLVMCQGKQLYQKIKKICDGMHASQYPLPEHDEQYRRMCIKVEKDLHDIEVVITQTQEQKFKTLLVVAQAEHFKTWVIQITKLGAIFNTMNLYQKTDKGFLAEGWVACSDYPHLIDVINQINHKLGVPGQACVETVQTRATPPTYFRVNKFTRGFQNIVDSYGVATYREMNPAPYTIITFPFLFAMMFADAGHGLIMMLFALWMVLYERKLAGKSNNEIWLTFFDGRYIILLMGLFSIYTGTIYNDIFAKGYNLFGTSFIQPPPKEKNNSLLVFDEAWLGNGTSNHTEPKVNITGSIFLIKKSSKDYPYGIDPAWQISQNKILFTNSFKMKLSVIVGVLQMFFGVMVGLMNHINRRDWVSILFEFIPQVIFLLALFGYMIGLIIAKWLIHWDVPNKAPSILIDFINMFLMKYPDKPEYLKPWFDGKQTLQTALLALALIQVPIMLLVKPAIKVFGRKSTSDDEHDEHGKESTGDIFIHQAIHTIEYCLGSVSHTASYLRLWALSLAHSQLSEVLWSMVMTSGFASSGSLAVSVIKTYLTFGFWAVLTVAILIVMEGLSAFLHALRLHWVEFQSKFYHGTGYMFRPFHLKRVLMETNILTES